MGGHVKMAANSDHQDQHAAGSVKQHPVVHDELHRANGRASDGIGQDSTSATSGDADTTATQYDVEHLATFSTTASSHETPNDEGEFVTNSNKLNNRQLPRQQQQQQQHQSTSEPRVALRRLFELEKLSGIWTQRMQIQLKDDSMLILDCETSSTVERFHRDRVQNPEAFNQYNGIYNNIIVFIIDQQASPDDHKEVRAGDESRKFKPATDCDSKTSASGGELHIFQCVSHRANQLVADILAWKSGRSIEIGEQHQQESKQCTTSHKQHQGSPEAQETTNDCNKMIFRKTEAPSATSSQADNKTTKQLNQSAGDELRRNTNNSLDSQQNDVSEPSTTVTTSSPNDPSTSTGDAAKPALVTVVSSSVPSENVPIVNVNVKETVQVFNQIAALREKGAVNNQTPSSGAPLSSATPASTRPLSSDVSVALSGQAEGISRVSALSSQLFKQRSIRATLAPKTPASEEQQQQQQGSSSADSSMASNATDGKAASPTVSAGSSSSHSELSNGRTMRVPAPPPAPNHKSHHRCNGAAESAANGAKSNDGHQLNGSPYTQSSSCSSSSSGKRQAINDAAGSKSSGPSGAQLSNGHSGLSSSNHRHQQSSSDSSTRRSLGSPALPSQQQLEQVTTNESYVSVLNHCFDDIEKFIIRLQQAYAAMHELQAKRRHSKKSASGQQLALTSVGHKHHKSHLDNGGGGAQKPQSAGGPGPPVSASELALLNARARGPNADDFFEILSKFKLAFNLLAKLKGCIHEPNAPELVHFLFTPLAIIIESARNVSPAVDPALVGIPYLNKDALELLSNCCTSKESDLWISLGPNWTQTIEPTLLKASRLPSSFQPIFSDGWAPVISELELIGLVAAAAAGDRAEPPGGHYRSSRAICAPPADGADLFKPSLASLNANHKTSEPASIKSPLTNGKSDHLKKRISPIPQDPYASSRQVHKSPYGPAGYLQEMAVGEQSVYRVPKMQNSQRVARQPIAKGSRRHPSDVYAAGHFSPPSAIGFLDDRTPYYPSGYPTNPSDDYTELQDDHLGAGPSGRRRQSSRATDYRLYDASAQPPLVDRAYADRLTYLPGDEPPLPAVYHHQRQYIDEAEREAMLLDLGPAQTEWFYELSSRGSLIVRVLFTRDANNDKELSVKRGEVLEILDDSRKWWKGRNIDLQVAYVPHTIVAVMDHYQTLDELLTNSPAQLIISTHDNQPPPAPPMMNSQHRGYAQPLCPIDPNGYGFREDHRRNSKTSRGAFRYF